MKLNKLRWCWKQALNSFKFSWRTGWKERWEPSLHRGPPQLRIVLHIPGLPSLNILRQFSLQDLVGKETFRNFAVYEIEKLRRGVIKEMTKKVTH